MDLKVYYQKLRQIESSISEPHVVIVSQETPDGGRAGVRTEAARGIAARMILEGSARLASAEEAAQFREDAAEEKRRADQLAMASKLQVTVVAEGEPRKSGNSRKGTKQ